MAICLIGHNQGWTSGETTTLMYYLLIGISCLAVIKARLPFNPLRISLSSYHSGRYLCCCDAFHHILEVNLGLGKYLAIFCGLYDFECIITFRILKLGIQNKLLNKVNANKTPHTQVEENVI